MTAAASADPRRVDSGSLVLGSMVFEFAAPVLARLARDAAADFLIVDLEETTIDLAAVRDVAAACHQHGLGAIVRLPSRDALRLAGQVLDLGATGVMAPSVDTARQAEQLVAATLYPPHGSRGFAHGAGDVAFALERNLRERPTVIVQIETVDGLDGAESIAAVDGVDVLWVGQRDLSISLGVPGQTGSETFRDAVRRIGAAAAGAGKAGGYLVRDAGEVEALAPAGYRWFALGSDVTLYREALTAGVARVRELRELARA